MSAAEISSQIQLDERGVAWIDETRVKVIEVAMDSLANRSNAEQMHLQYPHLSVAQLRVRGLIGWVSCAAATKRSGPWI